MDDPPPDDSKPVLPYAERENQPLPIAIQALISTVVTVLVIAAGVVAGGVFSIVGGSVGGDKAMYVVLVIGAVITIYLGIKHARRVGIDADSRGWVVGIYIGLGIGMLLWGFCGVTLYSVNHLHA